MIYAKDFFDLQVGFARRVSMVGGLPLEQELLDYTNLYVRFVGDRRFDRLSPVWIEYLEGVAREADLAEWTYRFYRSRPQRDRPTAVIATFGCFSYALETQDRIRLHFRDADSDPHGSLSVERQALRMSELKSLIAHVRREHASVAQVMGVSWLYNLPAYRRLFPDCYVASAIPAAQKFRNMPLWGQFLNRHGETREEAVKLFTQRYAALTRIEEIAHCFPLQPLAVSAPIGAFHAFYERHPLRGS